MLRSFRYPLKPNKSQVQFLELWLSYCHSLYNGALEERRNYYQKYHKSISFFDQTKSLTEIRQNPDWSQIPAVILRSPLKRLDKAYQGFFQRIKKGDTPGFPRFKAKDRYHSFSLMSSIPRIEDSRVKLPKLGFVKFHEYRPLKGNIKDILIKKESDGKWFIIFQSELENCPIKVNSDNHVGIDLGIKHFATLSDGKQIANPKSFRNGANLLAKRQQALQRKRKKSKSRQRAKKLVAKAHLKIKNQRKDFAWKLAKQLVSQYDIISYENLDIKNMLKGTLFLSKHINDAAWSQFIHCLTCKAEEAGKVAVGIDPRGTSQECSKCGSKVPKELSERIHMCDRCGLQLDRDLNAAINIDTLGYSVVMDQRRNSLIHAEVREVIQLE